MPVSELQYLLERILRVTVEYWTNVLNKDTHKLEI